MDKNKDNLKSLKPIMRKDGKPYRLKENINRFFFPKEYMKFEDCLKNKMKHSVKFLLNTGARINEARNVMVNDVDFSNNRMVIRVVKRKAAKKESRGKMRTIPISTQFTRYLNKYIKDNSLSGNNVFNVQSTPAVKIAMVKAARIAGIDHPEDFSAHTLRKTLEVWLMALGVQDIPLTAHFGHDIKTAASHYVSPDVFSWEERKKIREIIGDLYAR